MRTDRMYLFRVNRTAVGLIMILSWGVGAVAAQEIGGSDSGPVAEFVTGADEVPLMSGLVEVPGSVVVFDKPGGRIVEVQALGRATTTEIEEFYAAVLPQLGWRPATAAVGDGGLRFERENEVLTIGVNRRKTGDSLVSFAIAPHASPMKN